MEDIIAKLKNEVRLTEEQAVKVIGIFKDYLDKEGIDAAWDKLSKEKQENVIKQVKGFYNNVSEQTQNYTDKITDKVDSFAAKAKKSVENLSKKANDFFEEK